MLTSKNYIILQKNQEKFLQTPQEIIFNDSYLTTCTKKQKDIMRYIRWYNRFGHTRLTHGTIASACHCSSKTVYRAVTKFHQDAILFKNQENRFSPNNYTWNSKAFTIREEYIEDVEKSNVFFDAKLLQSENVQQSNISYINSLYIEDDHACAREAFQKTGIKSCIEIAKQEERDQDYAQRRKLIGKLSRFFKFTEDEFYKLTQFPAQTLQYCLKSMSWIILKKKRETREVVKDKFGFIFSMCRRYTFREGLSRGINLSWYVSYCKSRKKDHTLLLQKNPFFITPPIAQTPPTAQKHLDTTVRFNAGAYKVYVAPKSLTEQQEIERLEASIKNTQEILSEGKFNMFLNESELRRMLAEEESKLAALKNREVAYA